MFKHLEFFIIIIIIFFILILMGTPWKILPSYFIFYFLFYEVKGFKMSENVP
jgi:hypothetical protein